MTYEDALIAAHMDVEQCDVSEAVIEHDFDQNAVLVRAAGVVLSAYEYHE
jgi:hypothetical protein